MDEQTKQYLDALVQNLATKKDLEKLATKIGLEKVRKDLLAYLKFLDKEFSEHRANTEIHRPVVSF